MRAMALLDYPPLQPWNFGRSLKTHVPLKAGRDVLNRLRFGSGAPLSDEAIFVDPGAVDAYYRADPKRGAPVFRRRHSGLVRGGDWDLSVAPIPETDKIEFCRRRFLDGLSWEETGAIDRAMAGIAAKGSYDGLRSRAEVLERYAAIDRLYEQASREGRMRLREELPARFRREFGGIYIHVTREGRPVKAGGGVHRLAVAQILRLPEIPVQLGVIHRAAFEAGHLERLRRARHRA